MKKLFKMSVSLLMAVIMVLGMLPAVALAADDCGHEQTRQELVYNGNGTHTTVETCEDCGEVLIPETDSETAMIKVDLKQFAKDAAQQEWWSGLRPAVDENTKFVGNLNATSTMGDYEEAYSAMREYLAENECWNIDEDVSDFMGGFKKLYFNPTDSVPWGITLYTYYQGGAYADRGSLGFTVTAEKEGMYDLSMDVFKEYSSYTARQSITGDYPGGAHVDILVNGELVKTDFSFEDKRNIRLTEYVASVYLNEGENSVVLRPLHSYNGPSVVTGGRFNIAINSLVFVKAPQPVMAVGETLTVDPKAYVAFGDNNITAETHTVTSSDETVATVSFDENDQLVLSALRNGIAEVVVRKGSEETCKITVTVGATVACTDAEENGICDICEGKIGPCKHKKTTVVKTPNGDETTTTTETCDYCGEVVRQFTRSDKNIVVDFKEFAKDISQKSWWNDLVPSVNANTKYVGSAGTSAWMTDSQQAAYDTMLAYLDENYQWNIDESISNFSNARYWKRLFINCSDDVPWGLCYFPIYHNEMPDRSKLAFTIKVPEGKAGYYHFDLSVFKEESNYPSNAITDTHGGGGWADIWVNGALVYDEYSFIDNNKKFTDSMGAVYLNEGNNSVVIQSTFSYNNTAQAGRCNLDFCGMQFIPLEPVKVQEYLTTSVVLRETYLVYNASIEGFTVKSSNEWIATAELTAAGNVNISGVTQGEAEIYVMNGETVVCTIPVVVETFEGTLDELKGSPAKVDFMAVMDKAVDEDWWNDLTDGDDAGVKEVTLQDEALLNWLDSNTRWNLSAIDGTVTVNGGAAKYGLGVDGKAQVTVDLPAEGLYNVTVEYLRGGDTMDVSVNDQRLYAGLNTAGEAAAVKRSLGTVVLNKGINVFTFDAEGPVYLRSVTVTPLGSWQTEVGGERYINLNETYLPFDVAVDSRYTAVSDDPGVVTAAFDADGELILTGVSEGKTTVTVSGPNGFSALLTADVIEAGTFKEIVYTIDGFKAQTLAIGEVADGLITGLTTKGTPMSDKQVRKYGSIYLVSSNKNVATVDQLTGDVTCVAEGSAVISAYVLLDGISVRADVTVYVTDDTDLASIEIDAPVTYVGVGNALRLTASGLKSSGKPADMANYPVVFSIDESQQEVATITDDGRITGLKPGAVTVTATAAVNRMPITDTMEIQVVENDRLPSDFIMLQFDESRPLDVFDMTLEHDGVELVVEETSKGGVGMLMDAQGLRMESEVGDGLVFDFVVKKDGWYRSYAQGKQLTSSGGICHVFVDDAFVGIMDGKVTNSNDGAGGWMNTVYLAAGVHRVKVLATEKCHVSLGRVMFYPTMDPKPVEAQLLGKQELVIGESTELKLQLTDANRIPYTLLQQNTAAEYTNYFILESSNTKVATVSGMTIKGVSAGTAKITATCEILGEPVTVQLPVSVERGSFVSAELTAEQTTVKPDTKSIELTVVTYGIDGKAQDAIPADVNISIESADPSIATVSGTTLNLTGKEGSVLITATVTEGVRDVKAQLWITVTQGKTEPTVYTYEERATAQENVMKYSWAWSMKESAVRQADYYVENLEAIYDAWIPDTFPRTTRVGYKNDNNYRYCRYCGVDLVTNYFAYPYIVDPIENPWKITCPACYRDFPSNDFGAYYESGLGEDGKFHEELANKDLLVNELYPEKGVGWGVDDGWGYKADDGNYTFINYYLACVFEGLYQPHSMVNIFNALREAYLYTGDEKYGTAGAILVDRLADIYPDYEIYRYPWSDYAFSDGGSGMGKFIGLTWDGIMAKDLSKAVDAFWPAAENPEVIEFLQTKAAQKGVAPEDITPEYLRKNAEDGILLEIFRCAKNQQIQGNFGMSEAAVSYAAVTLDRLPESQEMLDWVFATETFEGSGRDRVIGGGDVSRVLVDLISRDGLGFEGSYSYNSLIEENLLDMADALEGYTRVENVDLWANQKFVNLYTGHMRMVVAGHLMPQIHEGGGPQSNNYIPSVNYMTTAFTKSGNREVARALYAANGNSTNGIHGDIFTKDPEGGIRSEIQKIIAEDGPWDQSRSDMLCGYGIAILREGPELYLGANVNGNQFSDYWIGFGYTDYSHAQLETLNLDLEAFGLGLSSSMGYPSVVAASDPERMQWVRNTISQNTVVVEDMAQSPMDEAGFPLHFADDGYAKVMDIDANEAYEQTDIYRRTLVAVDNGDGVHYAVDFFRVLGGSEHVYSFHGATDVDAATEGLELVHQAMGTYAGPDVPFGNRDISGSGNAYLNTGSGYSWMDDVYRDNDPETTFSVDWAIKDFRNRLSTSDGIHLKMTMLSEEPMTEVALANGYAPKKKENKNIDHLEYMLVRRSGPEGMDTLFTTVVEPYQFSSYIASSELVDVELLDGTEEVHDRAAAIKVTLTSGRVDYVVYATNPNCTYRIDDTFDFCGFVGVVSYTDGRITYAWGNEATHVAGVIEDAQASVKGTVTDFTKGIVMDGYTMTIEMDRAVSAEELTDQFIYITNDGIENAVYRIHGAEVSGNTAVLDLNHQTLVREYIDKLDLDQGYRYNIEVGQSYTIPLSAVFDQGNIFNYTTDQVVKAGSKLSLAVGVANSGVSYEAEGLPKGMKLDAKTGTLTWTTSRTQTGRYPITVKAVRDGEVVGEMSFVVYVVSYSGSSYAADNCAHSKLVTYHIDNADGTKTVETVCPACGTVTKTTEGAEEIEKFSLAGSNMTLGNELAVNFLMKASDYLTGQYAVVTHNGTETKLELTKYNNAYYAATYKVAAKEMADKLRVQIFSADGTAVSNVYEGSARDYAMKVLGMSTMSQEMKTMVVDMLNYGAEAQTFFGYNEEDLANSLLTDSQKALATKDVTCVNRQVKGTNFVGSNLSLQDRILLNMMFKGTAADGMYAEISWMDYKGVNKTVTVSKDQFGTYGSYIKIAVDEIVLADAFSLVSVTIYNKDHTVYGIGSDSVESYAKRTGDTLAASVMKFAASAKNYLS